MIYEGKSSFAQDVFLIVSFCCFSTAGANDVPYRRNYSIKLLHKHWTDTSI